jgi:hypothetical protein
MDQEKLLKEFKRCKEDPVYFMCNYIKVVHPTRGLVKFELYPFQKKIVDAIENNRFNILRKFRQGGCTTIASAYALWLTVFHKHKTVAILSKGDVESTEVLERIRIMYDALPPFLKPAIEESNKHTLKLATGSVIRSRPSGKQSGRSLSASLLIVDEAAFIENIAVIWAAAYPIISTGGAAFILSTVNGVGNWFYQIYQESISKLNAFNSIDIHWKDHPEYNRMEGYSHLYEAMEKQEPPLNVDNWSDITKANMPLKQWLQEYECEFLGTGETFIDGEVLKQLVENKNDDFYRKYNNRMRVWEDSKSYYEYVIGVDVALGRNRDYSAFHIINRYNGEQVAEFYSNRTPINEFAEIIAREASLYNIAHVVVERNTIGNNLLDSLYRVLEYENLWMEDKQDFGIQTTSKNRDIMLTKLEEYIRLSKLKLNSKRTIDELLAFIITDTGKTQAEKNHNDDLVMSLAFTVHVLDSLQQTYPVEMSNNPAMADKTKRLPEISRGIMSLPSYGGMTKEDIKWLMK